MLHTETEQFTLHHGNCLEVLPTILDNSIDSIVTDPPYELGFMGKTWDSSGIAYHPEVWANAYRILKPGGYLLAFGGSRTWHRLAVAIEDAGFEIRDSIAWLYGSGFPKSLDVSKAIDKAAGAIRERIEYSGGIAPGQHNYGGGNSKIHNGTKQVNDPATPEAQKWAGWGTALKPAFEPIVVARKPLQGTVAANVLKWETGAINIDGSRIPSTDGFEKAWDKPISTNISAGTYISDGRKHTVDLSQYKPEGRWPANVILDEYTAADLDQVARYFYCAKASKTDRNEGLEHLEAQRHADRLKDDGIGGDNPRNRTNNPRLNFHPTVKPTDLMRYLINLVTPPDGTVLDPFTGSGSTGKAAILENRYFIGIELTAEYLPIIEARLKHAQTEKPLL